MKNKASASIKLKSPSAVALWNCEVSGQLSDGNWENSRPHDHWEFWCDADVTFDRDLDVGLNFKVELPQGCYGPTRNAYNIVSLMNLRYDDRDSQSEYVLRDRMLAYARMGVAIDALSGVLNNEDFIKVCRAAEYMPKTKEEYEAKMNTPRESTHWSSEWRDMHIGLVEAYFAACKSYGPKEMRKDLTLIHDMMKSVPKW